MGHMRMRLLIVTIVVCGTVGFAQSAYGTDKAIQATIVPHSTPIGPTRVAGYLHRPESRLQPYANAWEMRLVGPAAGIDSTPLLWEDRLDTVRWNGRSALKREQIERRLVPVGGWQRITNVFDPGTLEPLMSESRQRNGMFRRYEFTQTPTATKVRQVTSGTISGGVAVDSTVREYEVASHFLDFYGGMYALVVAHFAPKVGASGTFRALVLPDTVVDVPYRVTGKETVRGPDGTDVQAYKATMGIGSGPGSSGGTFTAWLIDQPPYVLRLTTPAPRGLWSWDEVPVGRATKP